MTRPIKNNGFTDALRLKMCRSKVRYADELTAVAGAMISLEQHSSGYNKLWVYACPICRGHHLTKKRVSGKQPVMLDVRAAA